MSTEPGSNPSTFPRGAERSTDSILARYSSRLLRALARRSAFVLYATCVVSLVSFSGALSHWLELTSHFRPHYMLVLFVGSVWLGFAKRWKRLGLVLACFAVSAWSVVPWYLPPVHPIPDEANAVRILLANVLTSNTDHYRLLELVESEQPDLLVLLETNTRWIEALAQLDAAYPTQLAVPRGDNFGIALFSKFPILDLRVFDYGAEAPSILGELTLNGQQVQLIATHPLPPIGGEYSRLRNEQLSAIASSITGSTVVIGDLNMTMWSPYHARFEADSGLRNVRRGFGILPTWPEGFGPFKIPLDHCLVSDGIRVRDVRVGPAIGSDHLPLIVDLVSR